MAHPDEYQPATPEGSYHEPLDPDYGLDDSDTPAREVTDWTRTPAEVKSFIHESALREAELRDKGYQPDRIGADWNKNFRSRALELAIKYGDFADDLFLRPDEAKRGPHPRVDNLPEWARDFERRANADNDTDERVRDWRESQFKDD